MKEMATTLTSVKAAVATDETPQKCKVLLLGNLQSGKTTLFQRLTGQRGADLCEPESSLSVISGVLQPDHATHLTRRLSGLLKGGSSRAENEGPTTVLDTPGTATLFAQGEDEAATRDALLNTQPDTLLVVADATKLRRSLALVLQAAEFGLPMVVAVNMQDVARRRGIEFDLQALADRLGIAVVSTTAIEDSGIDELIDALAEPRAPHQMVRYPATVDEALGALQKLLVGLPLSQRGVGLLLLAGDGQAEQLVREQLGESTLRSVREVVQTLQEEVALPLQVQLTDTLYEAAAKLADAVECKQQLAHKGGWSDRIGRWAQHPVFGIPIAALVIVGMYYWVGALGATVVVDWLDQHLFNQFLIPATEAMAAVIPWQFMQNLLVDPDFGLLPTGLFLAFGIVLPILFFFYFYFALLNNSGYLPRLCVLLDRLLRRVGLNGRGVMPLVMGLSCITMALLTTRMMKSRKHRMIASVMLMLGLPCAPLLSVMLAVLAGLSFAATLTVFGFISLQVLLAGLVVSRLLGSESQDFILELPPLRWPRIGPALSQTFRRTYYFMKEAVPFFLLAALVLYIFKYFGGLALLEQGSRPVIQDWLGLPPDTVPVFIKTLVRRESGAAELKVVQGQFSHLQLVVTLLLMTFILPCINALIVLIKEQGAKLTIMLIGAIWIYGLLVGTGFHHLCQWLGITFT